MFDREERKLFKRVSAWAESRSYETCRGCFAEFLSDWTHKDPHGLQVCYQFGVELGLDESDIIDYMVQYLNLPEDTVKYYTH